MAKINFPPLSSVLRSLASGLRPPSSVLWLLPLAWLWYVLIKDLRVEWTVNPQYSYGWAVPFLCIFLIIRKIFRPPTSDLRPLTSGLRISTFYFLLSAFAFCYLPTRLIQEANPEWRFVSWALALTAVGITFCVLPLVLPHPPRSKLPAPSSPPSAFRFQISAFVFPGRRALADFG